MKILLFITASIILSGCGDTSNKSIKDNNSIVVDSSESLESDKNEFIFENHEIHITSIDEIISGYQEHIPMYLKIQTLDTRKLIYIGLINEDTTVNTINSYLPVGTRSISYELFNNNGFNTNGIIYL